MKSNIFCQVAINFRKTLTAFTDNKNFISLILGRRSNRINPVKITVKCHQSEGCFLVAFGSSWNHLMTFMLLKSCSTSSINAVESNGGSFNRGSNLKMIWFWLYTVNNIHWIYIGLNDAKSLISLFHKTVFVTKWPFVAWVNFHFSESLISKNVK